MRPVAKKKFNSPVRIKHLPPTLAEAVFAAQGLTDDSDQQAVIAADLMGVTVDEAKELVRLAAAAPKRSAPAEVTFSVDRSGAHRAVVVERRPSFTHVRKLPADAGGATVERMPFRGIGAQPRTLLRLGGSGR